MTTNNSEEKKEKKEEFVNVLAKCMPSCTPKHRTRIIHRYMKALNEPHGNSIVNSSDRKPMRLERIVYGITRGYIRHSLTNYEKLLQKDNMDVESAKSRIMPKVASKIRQWEQSKHVQGT